MTWPIPPYLGAYIELLFRGVQWLLRPGGVFVMTIEVMPDGEAKVGCGGVDGMGGGGDADGVGGGEGGGPTGPHCGADSGYAFRFTGRWAHSPKLVRRLAEYHGLTVEHEASMEGKGRRGGEEG